MRVQSFPRRVAGLAVGLVAPVAVVALLSMPASAAVAAKPQPPSVLLGQICKAGPVDGGFKCDLKDIFKLISKAVSPVFTLDCTSEVSTVVICKKDNDVVAPRGR